MQSAIGSNITLKVQTHPHSLHRPDPRCRVLLKKIQSVLERSYGLRCSSRVLCERKQPIQDSTLTIIFGIKGIMLVKTALILLDIRADENSASVAVKLHESTPKGRDVLVYTPGTTLLSASVRHVLCFVLVA